MYEYQIERETLPGSLTANSLSLEYYEAIRNLESLQLTCFTRIVTLDLRADESRQLEESGGSGFRSRLFFRVSQWRLVL